MIGGLLAAPPNHGMIGSGGADEVETRKYFDMIKFTF